MIRRFFSKKVVKILNKLINQVLTAKEEDQGNVQNKLRTVAYSLTVLLKAFEISDLSGRIEKIEEFIKCQESKADSKKRK